MKMTDEEFAAEAAKYGYTSKEFDELLGKAAEALGLAVAEYFNEKHSKEGLCE